MKKSGLVIALFVLVLMLIVSILGAVVIAGKTNGSDSTNAAKSSAGISVYDAKQIALYMVPGTVTDFENEKYNGVDAYSVEVTNGNQQTDVKIDMNSGAVLTVETDQADSEDANDNQNENDQADANDDKIDASEASDISNANEETSTAVGSISEDQAREIALSNVLGEVTDFEKEKYNGIDAYSVEITKGKDVTDVKIDMNTGKVLTIETGQDSESDSESDD